MAMETVKTALAWPFLQLVAAFKWLAQIFTEADGNGGKPSFSRVAGSVVIYNILAMVWAAPIAERAIAVPEIMVTLFWVLVGYQIVSKILNSLSPAVLDIAKGWMLRLQQPPAPKETTQP